MAGENDTNFETSQIISMFPTFVWQTMIKEKIYQEINSNILKKFSMQIQSVAESPSNKRWQSKQNLHESVELQQLMVCVNTMTKSVLQFLKIGCDDFEITGCWANINAKGTGHKIHSHPNNFLSGVYYVQTEEGSNCINFHDPRIQMGIIRPPVTELTSQNTDQVVVQVKDGMFLLFPSWLQHSVDHSQSEKYRISISFNIMFSSYVNTMSKPLW